MIEFLVDNLLLLPFLFVTYLVLEAVEARAGGALERTLGRVRRIGPLFGAAAGAVPQCGFSAAVASMYAGGVVSAGTLVAVFLSTSDELVPVLISAKAPCGLVGKILAMKVVAGLCAGVAVDGVLSWCGRSASSARVSDLCAHSRCGCRERHGIFVPALIHTCEIFVFILLVSGAVELCLHFCGESALESFVLNKPVVGELLGGLLGLVPNCAVSVTAAQMYLKGGMSAGALMASSLAGSGMGFAVLFRTNRNWRENLALLGVLYVIGVVLGHFAGMFL